MSFQDYVSVIQDIRRIEIKNVNPVISIKDLAFLFVPRPQN